MKILFPVLFFILLSHASFAETIDLRNGRSVTGKIVQKDDEQVQVDINGITMTYYMDEIKDIDGKSAAVPPPAPPPVPVTPEVPKITATQLPVVPSVPAKEDPAEKRALILKFIDVFGTRKAMTRNFDTMIDALSQQKPEEALRIRERFKIDEVIERLIPLYDKYFTSEDLKTYIDFYSSEKGQKLITSIGSIMKDSVQVGTAYLKEKFPEIDNKQ